mgnify:CR=1 FL=1
MYNSSYIISENETVTIFHLGELHTVDASCSRFDLVLECLKVLDYEGALEQLDLAKQVNIFGEGIVTVVEGVVLYNGTPISNSITSRILRMVREGFNVNPMVRFLENLMLNPSMRAQQEAYRFMESNDLPITEDGYFLAYKNVGENYYDKHTGTFRNMVGDTPSMPRSQVMDDPNQTCSSGLHLCSMEYLTKMWGHSGHTMIAKCNPADIVSCPVDYNNSKLRVSQYEIIGEHKDGKRDTVSEQAVYTQAELDEAYQDGRDDGYDEGYGYGF